MCVRVFSYVKRPVFLHAHVRSIHLIANRFDPLYILAQIVAVQCLYYLGLGTALFICVGPFVATSLTTSFIFDYRSITYVDDSTFGQSELEPKPNLP